FFSIYFCYALKRNCGIPCFGTLTQTNICFFITEIRDLFKNFARKRRNQIWHLFIIFQYMIRKKEIKNKKRQIKKLHNTDKKTLSGYFIKTVKKIQGVDTKPIIRKHSHNRAILLFRCQVSFCFKCCFTSCSCRGNCLAITKIMNIASHKNTRN